MTVEAGVSRVTIPAVAIHGVGRHEPGQIEAQVRGTLGAQPAFDLAVSEFNWDRLVDHRAARTPADALRSLRKVCASVHATAIIALAVRQEGLDTRLSDAQIACAHLLRHLIVVVLAGLSAIPAVVIVVFIPSDLLQIGPVFQAEALRWLASWLVPVVAALATVLAAAILGLGGIRALVQRSSAPLRSSATSVVLAFLNPFLAIVSTPLSVSWPNVAALVILVCVLGLLAWVTHWLWPDQAVYSAWRDPAVAGYLAGVLGAIVVLQGLRYLFAQVWYEGPIKILLDIARYVGDPVYRWRTLSQLDAFVEDRQGSADRLVIVAHSLGTIIALDYLCNWGRGRPDRSVWLVTLGSPYRRFFRTWLPGVLFHGAIAPTVARIRGRSRSFRWLNVFRPWDYIGTSLDLQASQAGADRSTRQYLRFNGHADYWRDEVVLATIGGALASVAERPADADLPAPAYIPDSSLSDRRAAGPHFLWLAGGLACAGLLWMAYAFVEQQAYLARTRAAIDERGIRRQVLVSHREIPDVSGAPDNAREFSFIADGLQMPPYQLSPLLSGSLAQQRLDYRRLEAFVRSDCVLERETTFFDDERRLRCTSRQPIEMAYLPPASNFDFYLPGFPSRFYFNDAASWFLYPLIAMVVVSIGALPFVMLTSALYAVFLGRDPHDSMSEIFG